ncbi:hypothetical protein GGR56DRAFT_121628 [Xylariaceae sp. FL0804]|nr:hypothetical protein GGR56DRAFT_121628 [Xylariaceae sp. FL0804]
MMNPGTKGIWTAIYYIMQYPSRASRVGSRSPTASSSSSLLSSSPYLQSTRNTYWCGRYLCKQQLQRGRRVVRGLVWSGLAWSGPSRAARRGRRRRPCPSPSPSSCLPIHPPDNHLSRLLSHMLFVPPCLSLPGTLRTFVPPPMFLQHAARSTQHSCAYHGILQAWQKYSNCDLSSAARLFLEGEILSCFPRSPWGALHFLDWMDGWMDGWTYHPPPSLLLFPLPFPALPSPALRPYECIQWSGR